MALNALIGLAIVASGFSYFTVQNEFQAKQQEALYIADTVASMPELMVAFHQTRPSTVIQPLVEHMRRRVGAEFIVVANMKLIRYSHPDPKEIGKKMGENDGPIILNGQPSISEGVGTLGLSVRARVPIFDGVHRQIGIVSVGFLVHDIWKQIFTALMKVVGLSLIALIFSIVGAHLLSGNVKRRIFGMEPFEIAQVVQEQSAIMQSIQEGILAVNDEGYITACNAQAKRILSLESSDLLGKHLVDAVPYPRLCTVIEEGPNHIDHPMIIGASMILVNRVPVLLNNKVIGAVITFRDKMQLDQVEQRLEAIDRYADALRSQRHEFMNRLHTISGLIQLREYDEVQELIDEIHNEQNQLLAFFANRIRDPAVLAIIIGKMHRAKELGIQLNIDPDSRLSVNCCHRDVVVTVLGNSIDNAMEAISTEHDNPPHLPAISVYVNDDSHEVVLTVEDTGPGIDAQLGSRIFEDGISTKGPGRGFGLSLCSQLVAQAKGKLVVMSSTSGAKLEMTLPKGEQAYVV